jgi:hypothetical protein
MVSVDYAKNLSMLKPAKCAVLYDSTGKVVDIYEVFEEHAGSMTDEALEKIAFDSVAKRPEIYKGLVKDASELKILHVKPDQLRPTGPVTLHVDLASKSLVGTPLKLDPEAQI